MQKRHTLLCWGITAPIALQLLTELFLENSNLDNLQKYILIMAKYPIKTWEVKPKEVGLGGEKSLLFLIGMGDVIPNVGWGRR